MEKRKSALSVLKACRFCLTKEGSLSSLYDRSRTPKNAVTLPLQILSCVSVEVFPSDKMPAQICDRCRFYMDICYRFKQICRQADETIMQHVQVEGPLDPVAWHPKLTKLYRSANEPAKREKGKSPNAQAIAVTAAASNDEEESDEDEDVYNIKIGDGPDDSKETCIKVVKTGDKLHITKDNSKSKPKKDADTDGCEQTDNDILHSEEVVIDLVEDDDSDESVNDPLPIHKSASTSDDVVEVSNRTADPPEIITILDDDTVSKVDDTSDVDKRPVTQDSQLHKSQSGSHEDVPIDQRTKESLNHNQTFINTDITIQENNISSSNSEELVTVIPTETSNEMVNPVSNPQTVNAIPFWVGHVPRGHSNVTILTPSSENSSPIKQDLSLESAVIPSRHNESQLNEANRNEQSSSTDAETTVAAIEIDIGNELLNSHSALETGPTLLPHMEKENVPSIENVQSIEDNITDSNRLSKSIESSLTKDNVDFAGPGPPKVDNSISENDETNTNIHPVQAEIHSYHDTLPDINMENKNCPTQSNENMTNHISLHNDEDSQIHSILPKDGYLMLGDPDRSPSHNGVTCMDDQDFHIVVIVQDDVDERTHEGTSSRLSISPDRVDENTNSKTVGPDVDPADTNSAVIHIISSNESSPIREKNIEDVWSPDNRSVDQIGPLLNLNHLPFWDMNGTIGRTQLTITDEDIEEEIPTESITDRTLTNKLPPQTSDSTITTAKEILATRSEISIVPIGHAQYPKRSNAGRLSVDVSAKKTAAIDYTSDDDVVEVPIDRAPPTDKRPLTNDIRVFTSPHHCTEETFPSPVSEVLFSSPRSRIRPISPSIFVNAFDGIDQPEEVIHAQNIPVDVHTRDDVIEVITDKTRSTKTLETTRQSNKNIHSINDDRVYDSRQSGVQGHAQTDSDQDLSEDDVVEVLLDHNVIDIGIDLPGIPKHKAIVKRQYRQPASAYKPGDMVTTPPPVPPRKRNYSGQQLHLIKSQDVVVEVQLDPLTSCSQEKTKSQDPNTYAYTLAPRSEEPKDLARTVLRQPQKSDEATITCTAESEDQPVQLTPISMYELPIEFENLEGHTKPDSNQPAGHREDNNEPPPVSQNESSDVTPQTSTKDFPYVYVGSQTFTTSLREEEDYDDKEAGDQTYDEMPNNNPIKNENTSDGQSTSKGKDPPIVPEDKLNSRAIQGCGEPNINDFPYIYVDMSVLDHLPDLVPNHTDLQDKANLIEHKKTKIPCPECPLVLSSQTDFNYHQLSTHKRNEAIQCIVCEEWLNRGSLWRHLRRIHPDKLKYRCPKCALRFMSISELLAHESRHLPTPYLLRRYVCSLCYKRFHTDLNLEYHKLNIHQGLLHTCELCPQSFNTPMRLARHLQVDHGVSRPYPCKYCEKSFLKSHHYTRHMRMKHKEHVSTGTPFNDNLYHCEQCEDSFSSQDELIYHSAQHATENLTCPLCHEKFDHVEEVSAHIKTHVDGEQFMCDLCELVFTSRAKLDSHLEDKHEEEMAHEQDQDEEDSMDVDDEDDDNNFNVKEEEDELVVEVKKPDEFMITAVSPTKPAAADTKSVEIKTRNMPALDAPAVVKEATTIKTDELVVTKSPQKNSGLVGKKVERFQEAGFVQRVEEAKQVVSKEAEKVASKVAPASAGASEKSLRLLEKELQELKRTNSENDAKIPAKSADVLRSSRRPQVHSSTPKTRPVEEKKTSTPAKSVDKKQPEKRVAVTKENKEPKDKETKQNNNSVRETTDKETPAKTVVKNGAADRSSGAAHSSEENPRRSSRGSKVKDYAKMVNQRQSSRYSSDDSDDDDEEYTESVPESRGRARRMPAKPAAAAAEPAPAPRKRGRPRRDALAKVKKPNVKDDDETEDEQLEHGASKPTADTPAPAAAAGHTDESTTLSTPKPPVAQSPKTTIVSPTGQTLKKVQLKSLPPGIKPLPLPRSMNQGELCEMQIGKKVVKVQKIVMTKAEVEAMAKKGLLEMKDGTMVLKQGIKLPTSDVASLKSTLVGATGASKESPVKPAPTRCDIGND